MPKPQPDPTSADPIPAGQTLAHPVGTLYEIRWSEICPWLILVKALRVTLLVRVLLLALVGMLLTQWGWTGIDRLFSIDAVAVHQFDSESLLLNQAVQSHTIQRGALLLQRESGTFLHGWYWLTEPFLRLADRGLTWNSSLGFTLRGLWGIAVWGLFGGAIARTAAMYLARGETLGPLIALREAIVLWPSTVGAPLIVLLAAAAMAVPLVLLGLLIQLNFMAVLVSLLWVFVLTFGFMLAIVLLGLAIGWPLMWACLGVERSDAFDGVSRCYAYVYQKPLQMAFYVAVATLLGLVGDAVVAAFVSTAITLSEWVLSWGTGVVRADQLLTTEWQASVAPLAARAINGWTWAFMLVIKSYPLACLWPMSVGIYLLLRRHVDATEMEEISLENDETLTSLTALTMKKSGVPEVERPTEPTEDADEGA